MEWLREKRRHGISLTLVSILMVLAGIAASGLVLFASYQSNARYADVEKATQDFLNCQDDIYAIQDAINGLDDRARNFVINGNVDELVSYFIEVQVRRNISACVDELKVSLANEQKAERYLESAIGLNDLMAERQWYAMRLAIEGYGYTSGIPIPLQTLELTAEDLAMTAEQQLEKARNLLYSKDYTRLKDQTDVRINLCKDTVAKSMTSRLGEYSDRLQRLFRRQGALVLGLTAILLGVLAFVLGQAVYPIHRLVQDIQSAKTASAHGSRELRFLSETYNQMFKSMEDANAQLSYEAAHDALTGLYNRAAFEAMRRQYDGEAVGLLIVDVDLFKKVNDLYGHDVGDRVLVRVADVLRGAFRGGDRVCRIGGDEFAVIMVGASASGAGAIRQKLKEAAAALSRPDGDVPAVTFSAGCAFSDRMAAGESLYKNADRALYRVKENGRNDVGFYPEE